MTSFPDVTSHYRDIGGGEGYPVTDEARKAWIAQAQAKYGLPDDQIDRLLERYGTYATSVMDYIIAGQDMPLEHQPTYSQHEIEFIVTNEDVVRLDDLIMRRTLIGLEAFDQLVRQGKVRHIACSNTFA
jgi:glycerol-3-phosphate dehydrogenase